MNSYPPELLTQLAPLMFVAGLDAVPPPPAGTPARSQDSFSALTARLRDSLMVQRKVAIWQPEKNKTFNVVLVDRVRLLPIKALCVCQRCPGSAFPASEALPARRSGPLASLAIGAILATPSRRLNCTDLDTKAHRARSSRVRCVQPPV